MLPFRDLFNLLYPRLCPACGHSLQQQEEILCLSCLFSLPLTNFHLVKDNPAEKIFWGRCSVKKAASYLYFKKGGKVQELLHHIKYAGMKEAAQYLGKLYGEELNKSAYFGELDCIIPVPLHEKKQRRRGYNQSEFFGIGLSGAMNKPLETNMLLRTYNADSQTRKSRFNRWRNVAEIFAVPDPEKLAGKKILLIDDVVTTGATLESCANALLKLNRGIEINIATLAFAT